MFGKAILLIAIMLAIFTSAVPTYVGAGTSILLCKCGSFIHPDGTFDNSKRQSESLMSLDVWVGMISIGSNNQSFLVSPNSKLPSLLPLPYAPLWLQIVDRIAIFSSR
jgi:hypothetical protein